MSFKSFFDYSFFIDLITMPLKGGTSIKINNQLRKLTSDDKKEDIKSDMRSGPNVRKGN